MNKIGRTIIILTGLFTFSTSSLLCSYYYHRKTSKMHSNDAHHQKRNIKILVLIIASDQLPIYRDLQKIWRSYMHYDPEHVEAYFLKDNPNLPTLCEIDGDIIWSKTTPGWIPQSPGILNKTLFSLEKMMPRIKEKEFDYIIRTNLSSFYIFPRMLKFLETLPTTNCYYGSNPGWYFGSGCGFLVSPDLAEMMVNYKDEMLDNIKQEDDVVIGTFFKNHGIKIRHYNRLNIFSLDTWFKCKAYFPTNIFHCRVRPDRYQLRPDHLTDEIYIQKELVKTFYHQ